LNSRDSVYKPVRLVVSLICCHSLCCLCISLGLAEHFPEGVVSGGLTFLFPPVYAKSSALHNFLLTAAILGPVGWIMSQFLDCLNYWFDSGSNTCGLNFSYTEKMEEEKENAEDERTLRDVIVTTMYNTEEDETSTLRDDILSSMSTIYNNKVPFECETGRWIHPKEREEQEEQGFRKVWIVGIVGIVLIVLIVEIRILTN